MVWFSLPVRQTLQIQNKTLDLSQSSHDGDEDFAQNDTKDCPYIMMVLLFVVLTLKNAKWLKNLAGAHSEECGSASTTHRPIFDLRLPVMIMMMVAYLHICIFAHQE